MDTFNLYLQWGWSHIIDTDALDHQLFILAIVTGFYLKDWKKLFVLATAFTLGHSVTLALSASHLITISPKWIEVFIAATIIITAFENLFIASGRLRSKMAWKYSSALLFGLVHGLGFAYSLSAILGKEHSLLVPLAGFNVGLELGQLAIICIYLILTHWVPSKWRKGLEITISGLVIMPAFYFLIERLLEIQ